MTSSKYQIWLEAGKKKHQLPVNPESIKIQRNGNNQSVTIAGLGETTVLQEPKAVTISFSSFFPKTYFPGCTVKKPLLPHAYINAISTWLNEKTVVRLYITKCDIVWYATIESFSYSQSGGDVGSYDYTISLKSYKTVRVRQININKNKKASAPKKTNAIVNTKSKPKTYTVKSGDSLYNIAKKYYGDGSKYTKIYEANKKIIGSNPNLIKAGQVLTIP